MIWLGDELDEVTTITEAYSIKEFAIYSIDLKKEAGNLPSLCSISRVAFASKQTDQLSATDECTRTTQSFLWQSYRLISMY